MRINVSKIISETIDPDEEGPNYYTEKTYQYALDIDAGVDVLRGIYKNGY